jgi:hypothetical protein
VICSNWHNPRVETKVSLDAGRGPDSTQTLPLRQKLRVKSKTTAEVQGWEEGPFSLAMLFQSLWASCNHGAIWIFNSFRYISCHLSPDSFGDWSMNWRIHVMDGLSQHMPSIGRLGCERGSNCAPFTPQNSLAQSPSGRTASP